MKKKLMIILIAAALILVTTTVVLAGKPIKTDANGNEIAWESSASSCTTIQDGILLSTDGVVISTGYNDWGYNYQVHMVNGDYCNYDYNNSDCQDNTSRLMMKWSDSWLANTDCDGDGKLDRHYGFPTYIGSGAWLTNHESGEYLGDGGETCSYNYFVKIIAAPADAYVLDGYWYAADGTEIGEVIWGAFAIIQQVENDSCAGLHGLQYRSPVNPGLGGW